jgi:hypothetical protein
MGIMPCNRRGCQAILCEKYSPKYGYICQNCYNELLDYPIDIASFMMTHKLDNQCRLRIEENRKLVREEFGEE